MKKIAFLVEKAIWVAFCLSLSRFTSHVTAAKIELDVGLSRAVKCDANLHEDQG